MERKPAPWRAQYAQPGNAIFSIEKSVSERKYIEHLGTLRKWLEVDSPKWDRCIPESLRDRGKGRTSAPQYCDTIFVSTRTSLIHPINVGADQRNHRLCLRIEPSFTQLRSRLFFSSGIGIRGPSTC